MAQHYKNESITKSRIKVFLGWENFNTKGNVAPGRKEQNLLDKVWTAHCRSTIKLSVHKNSSPLKTPTSDSLAKLSFSEAHIGEKFGPTFSTHIFKLNITVPETMRGQIVHLLWDSNSEALVLSEEGVPRQGLVGGDHWARRTDYQLCNGTAVEGGERVTLFLEMACNGLFGAGRGGDIEPPDMERFYELEECCLAVFNPTAWSLIHDLTLLSGLAEVLPAEVRKVRALQVANEVVNAVDVGDKESFERGREVAKAYLAEKNGDGQTVVHSMLHSHIDLAWLWPMAATPAKGARTFATHLRLMEMYDDCIFVQSQAQLYEWVKENHPALWKEVCARVKEGRFVPVGGTWVEMDCNLPCGESLVRQFLLGQGFFKEEFGKRCREFWLPDTFGYAAQLPQIMRGCGVDRFMTIKLSWNLFNKFPHSTFVWEGLDGSRVLAHMPPADTYNAQAFPDEVLRTGSKNKDAAVINRAAMLVGHGDGGGGASPSMLESMRRMRNLDGIPKVQFSTPDGFFDMVEKKKHELPRWVGELYFELHRGTYTSQAITKKKNRQCEHLLRDVEILSSIALLLESAVGKEYSYPSKVLKSCWKLVLKNCFHDTLPGSCIGAVYEETDRDYAFVKKNCQLALEAAFASLSESIEKTSGGDSQASKRQKDANGYPLSISAITNENNSTSKHIVVFNRTTGWGNELSGRPLVTEVSADFLGEDVYTQALQLQAKGSKADEIEHSPHQSVLAVLRSRPGGVGLVSNPSFITNSNASHLVNKVQIVSRQGSNGVEYVLSNNFVEAIVHSSGRLTSLVLCHQSGGAGRQALSQEATNEDPESKGGNRLIVYDDVSQFWCGWDTEVYSFEKKHEVAAAISCEIIDKGPLQASLHVKYPPTKAGSTIEQYIILRSETARLDFCTNVDWKETRKILRVQFNTQIRSPHASYDSQFGYVRRPTTFNHSWEIAKFEVVGHQYCDLSEHKFGMALLNDCKYGYSVRDSTMRLSLLRAPKSPDDKADIGMHSMTYALLPHWEGFPSRAVIDEAAHLNCPPVIRGIGVGGVDSVEDEKSVFEFVSREAGRGMDSVVISAVKQAERGGKMVVVRMYEAMGARGTVILKCPEEMKVESVRRVNMLEEEVVETDTLQKIVFDEEIRTFEIPFTPFQIQTVMIEYS